jgi:hypothetical protein
LTAPIARLRDTAARIRAETYDRNLRGTGHDDADDVAGILHGSEEPTGDLDILWDGAEDNRGRLAESLARAGVRLRDEKASCSATSSTRLGRRRCTSKAPGGRAIYAHHTFPGASSTSKRFCDGRSAP